MKVETIRTFIALPLAEDAKTALATISRQMATAVSASAVRWVTPEQMHLTLLFLGETAVSQLPALSAMLTDAATAVPPFTLQLGELGCFPNRRRPRVLWVGLTGSAAALARLRQLQQAIAQGAAALGWAAEQRPFQPHLTLGRVKDSQQTDKLNWQVKVEKVAVPVTAVHLVQSQLRPSGPIYTTKQVVSLGGMAIG